MLVSHSRRFIFVHLPKNAGTSVTRCLQPFAETRLEALVQRHPLARRVLGSLITCEPYRTHIRAREIRENLGPQRFDSYFSFAIVRNPWDRHVSFYNYKLKKTASSAHAMYRSFGSFESYVTWACVNKPMRQKPFVCAKDGEQVVNFIARFENLDEDFRRICGAIGIAPRRLPKLNSSSSHSYRDYYTDATRELVRKACAADIELFGYDF